VIRGAGTELLIGRSNLITVTLTVPGGVINSGLKMAAAFPDDHCRLRWLDDVDVQRMLWRQY